jgi:dienelactone hydrolase
VLIDAASGIRQLASMKRFSKIFVLGHSLGAMLAPKIAKENAQVDGIIMMAGNARPLETLIWEQYNYIMQRDGIDEYEKNALAKLEVELQNLEKLKLNGSVDNLELPIGLPMAYWKSLNAYKQTEVIKSVKCKILILQGERDYQVTMEDLQLWKKALKGHEGVEFQTYPMLNHLFLEGEGSSYPEEYQKKGNVASYVVKDIAEWILRQD